MTCLYDECVPVLFNFRPIQFVLSLLCYVLKYTAGASESNL